MATDIAARGIDVDGVDLVVNYELPNVAENYVHRIGRTARAGASGRAVALCAPDERVMLKDIEKTMGVPIQGLNDAPPMPKGEAAKSKRRRRGGRRGQGQGQGDGGGQAQASAPRSGEGSKGGPRGGKPQRHRRGGGGGGQRRSGAPRAAE